MMHSYNLWSVYFDSTYPKLAGVPLDFIQVKDNHVLVCTDQNNMLARLVEANQLLEEIQKGLNAYLEQKQLFFPR